MKLQKRFAILELAVLLVIGVTPLFGVDAFAEGDQVQESDGGRSVRSIVNEDGRKIITNDWPPKRNTSAPPIAHQTSSFGSRTPLAHARELMETGGIGGVVEARAYMDMVDARVAERNCTPGNEQQPKFVLQQSDIDAAKAYVNELLNSGGLGGAAAARKYTDMINGLIAAQNCTLSDYQQQREINKISNEQRRMKSQQITDRMIAH